MFTSAILLFATLAASASALTINTPTNWKGNTTNVVTWTSTSTDPSIFTIELVNPQFNPSIGVANNVGTNLGSIGVPLPRLAAGSGFTLQFVSVSNINDVLATSSPFTITENDVDGESSSATISAASTAPGTPGGTPTTVASSPSATATAPSASTTGSESGTSASASNTNTAASTGASNSSAPSPSPSGGAQPAATLSGALLAALFGFLILTN